MSEQTIGTTCVQGGYHPGDAEPRQVPIYQSTTWKYDTSEHMGKLFDLEESGYFYSRLQNPTCDLVAAKICEMEGGTAAMLTSLEPDQQQCSCALSASCGHLHPPSQESALPRPAHQDQCTYLQGSQAHCR